MLVELRDGNGVKISFNFSSPDRWKTQGGEFLLAYPTGYSGKFSKVFVKRYPIKNPAPAGTLLRSMIGHPLPNTPEVYGCASDSQYEYFFFEQISGNILADLLSGASKSYLKSDIFTEEFLNRLIKDCSNCLDAIAGQQWIYTDFCAKNIFITKQNNFLIDLDSALQHIDRDKPYSDKVSMDYWGLWLVFKLPCPLMVTQLASFAAVLGRAYSIVKKGADEDQALERARKLLRSPSFTTEQSPLWDGLSSGNKKQVLEFWNLPNDDFSDNVFNEWRSLLSGFKQNKATTDSVLKAWASLIQAISANSPTLQKKGNLITSPKRGGNVGKKRGFSKFIGPALIGIPIFIFFIWLFIPKQSPEAQVEVPHAANIPNKRQNDIKTQPEIINQPEVNNPPRLAEPQDVSNFTVTIRSSPPGATVYLDRNRVGITPFTTTLKKGLYGIKIEKDGYQRKIGQIEDGRQDFYVELLPE